MSTQADPPQRPRERKKLEPRRTIQAEALRLFQTQGYEQTAVEQIAEAAETSTTNFYRTLNLPLTSRAPPWVPRSAPQPEANESWRRSR
jgi:hypothetical protein